MLVIMVFCLYNLILNNVHDPSVHFPSLSYFHRPWGECSINYPCLWLMFLWVWGPLLNPVISSGIPFTSDYGTPFSFILIPRKTPKGPYTNRNAAID